MMENRLETLRYKLVRTRKPHKCWGCAVEYPKGTEMHSICVADGGEMSSYHYCKVCEAYYAKFVPAWDDEGYAFGDLAQEDNYQEFKEQREKENVKNS